MRKELYERNEFKVLWDERTKRRMENRRGRDPKGIEKWRFTTLLSGESGNWIEKIGLSKNSRVVHKIGIYRAYITSKNLNVEITDASKVLSLLYSDKPSKFLTLSPLFFTTLISSPASLVGIVPFSWWRSNFPVLRTSVQEPVVPSLDFLRDRIPELNESVFIHFIIIFTLFSYTIFQTFFVVLNSSRLLPLSSFD